MMHTRKQFLIYPPNYKPGDGYKVRHSKRQAWKVAVKMGEGAVVDVSVCKHPARCRSWISSCGYALWEVIKQSPSKHDASFSERLNGFVASNKAELDAMIDRIIAG